jgi:hypothetical protein
MKSKRCSVSAKGLAELLTIITLLGVAPVASSAADSPRGCDPGAATAEYDRKADDFEAAAERYRGWARAEEMFATNRYGSGWDLAQHAARLEAAAQESRARAAESRSREDSTGASVDGCGPQAPAGVQGRSSMTNAGA